MTKNRLIRQFFNFLTGAVLSAVIVEMGLQVIEKSPLWEVLPIVEPILGQPDPLLGYALSPGAKGVWPKEHRARIRINSLGLRDGEMEREKPAGLLRVGLLGDSMIEALQVDHEDTFEAIAERELNLTGDRVQLVNLAMSGSGPLRQLLRLEKTGYGLDLNLGVAFASFDRFLNGELLNDSYDPGYVSKADGTLVIGYSYRERRSQRLAETWIGKSWVVVYQNLILPRMLYLKLREPWQRLIGIPTRASKPVFSGSTEKCASLYLRKISKFLSQQEPIERWQATEKFFRDLQTSTRQHNVPVIYAITDIPVVHSDCEEEGRLRLAVVDQIKGLLGKHGIEFFDWNNSIVRLVTPDRNGQQRQMHWDGGGHLNYYGHSLYAQALVELLDGRLP
jgi:hypothetical protein